MAEMPARFCMICSCGDGYPAMSGGQTIMTLQWPCQRGDSRYFANALSLPRAVAAASRILYKAHVESAGLRASVEGTGAGRMNSGATQPVRLP
jgi:hypothetical protein